MRASERVTAGAVVVLACITFGGPGQAGVVQQQGQEMRTVLSASRPSACAEPGSDAADPTGRAPVRHVPGTMRAV